MTATIIRNITGSDIPIEHMDFDLKTMNVLRASRIYCLQHLLNLTLDDLILMTLSPSQLKNIYQVSAEYLKGRSGWIVLGGG